MDYDKMIEGMCMTYRHDYGLEKDESVTFADKLQCGMTAREREALQTTMRQLIEHNVKPVIESLQRENQLLANCLFQAQQAAIDAARQQYACNACNWTGKLADTFMLGSVGPLCPECRETTDRIG